MTSFHRPAIQVGDVAKIFDGRRLKQARQLAGLRKNALAELIDKTPTAVAAYENNTKRPAPSTVAQLCLALSVEPSFFLPGPGNSAFPTSVPHFRSLRSTSQLLRDQAFAYGMVAVDVASTLERHVEFPEPRIPQLHLDIDADDHEGPETAARYLRKSWGPTSGPVRHLLRSAENNGILVIFSPPQTAAVDAYSFDAGIRPVVVLNPVKEDYFRQRFDIAHEIGHLVMHGESEPGGKTVEDQAHRFAAEFLMPANELTSRLPMKADWRKLNSIKEEYGVSLQALLFRSRELGVMSPVTYRNAVMYLSSNGWKRREPGVMPALEQPSLLPRAIELLTQANISEKSIAQEARVPFDLFEVICSRAPKGRVEPREPSGDGPEEASGEVVSLF